MNGAIIWLTGLSGAGKSTIAEALTNDLRASGQWVCLLDGDAVRTGLNRDLGFSEADRTENVRRIAAVAALVAASGGVAVVPVIAPRRAMRAAARVTAGAIPFIEVHVATSLAVCEARDTKGLYRKARAGLLKGFTGIDDPYEDPEAPEVRIDTTMVPVADAVALIKAAVAARRPA